MGSFIDDRGERFQKYLEKKEQGDKPCSKNCVDPISPKSWI
jgi:hypothetical protein